MKTVNPYAVVDDDGNYLALDGQLAIFKNKRLADECRLERPHLNAKTVRVALWLLAERKRAPTV